MTDLSLPHVKIATQWFTDFDARVGSAAGAFFG